MANGDGSGFTGFWDKMLTTPSGGSLIGALTGQDFDQTPQGQETLRNLYAQGYMGEGNPDVGSGGGIVHQRVGLGALLQHLGILGEAAPTQATPYERYEYGQGSLAHQKEALGMAKEQQGMEAQKQLRHMEALKTAMAFAGAGGGVVSGLGDFSPGEIGGLGGISKTADEGKALQIELKNAQMEHMKAMEAITLGKQPNASDVVSKYSKDLSEAPASKMLLDQYKTAMKSAEKDATTGQPVTDPWVKLAAFNRAKQYQTSLTRNAHELVDLIDPSGELGDRVALQALGDSPVQPWAQAFGVNPVYGHMLEQNPELQQNFAQLWQQHQQSGSLLGAMSNPASFLAERALPYLTGEKTAVPSGPSKPLWGPIGNAISGLVNKPYLPQDAQAGQ